MSRTFVEALKEKYCDDGDGNEENFVVDIVFSNRPRRTSGSSADDVELGYLKNVVLCSTSISNAGIPSCGLSSLCPNVIDLDISSNDICAWEEVLSIFHHLPALKFVNLSGNPLGEDTQENAILCLDQTFGIDNLVLNNTKVTWKQATDLACLLPNLRELHLCQNGYKEIVASIDRLCESLPLLQCLRLNENYLSRWEDIAKLGSLPHLHTLILSDNPLLNIAPVTTRLSAHKPVESNHPESSCDPSLPVLKNNDDGDALFLDGNKPAFCDESDKKLQVENSKDESELDAAMTTSTTSTDNIAGHKVNKAMQELDAHNVGISGSGELQGNEITTDVSVSIENDKLYTHDSNMQHPDKSSANNSRRSDNEGIHEEGAEAPKDTVTITTMLFQSLSVLCVSNTRLCSWNDLDALTTFPKLTSLKIRDIPLQQEVAEEERWRLLIASLPNVKILNGSEIKPTDIDKSERHYVRYFSDKPDPPKRYKELVQKYGELKSLPDIDIGHNFREYAYLSFIYGGRCIHQETVRIVEPVRKLKVLCGQLVKKHARFICLYYQAKDRDGSRNGPEEELQELFLDSLPMSRYDMMDGDEIHIDVLQRPKQKKQIKMSFQTTQGR